MLSSQSSGSTQQAGLNRPARIGQRIKVGALAYATGLGWAFVFWLVGGLALVVMLVLVRPALDFDDIEDQYPWTTVAFTVGQLLAFVAGAIAFQADPYSCQDIRRGGPPVYAVLLTGAVLAAVAFVPVSISWVLLLLLVSPLCVLLLSLPRPAKSADRDRDWFVIAHGGPAIIALAAVAVTVVAAPMPGGGGKSPVAMPDQGSECSPYYSGCLPADAYDVDCYSIDEKNIEVAEPDPYRLDGDNDGIGCETW